MERLVAELRAVVGDAHVLVDDDVRAGYETDWTGRWSGTATAVVRPASTAEVADVLRVAGDIGAGADPGVAMVTQGGNTGLVGGGVPRPGSSDRRPTIVLSTRRLDDVGPVDRRAAQVTVGAGVTIAAWRAAARAVGLDAPVDFAARDSATVGGAIATNAGGSRVLRFGTMRRQVVGIEAVLADGSIIGSLAGLPKETAGVHWPALLCGSEGTLGVVTRARLRLVPRFERTITAMVTTTDLDDAVTLLGELRATVTSLDAVELLLPEALDLVAGHLSVDVPVAPPPTGTVLLVECADHRDPAGELLDALAASDVVVDSALATDPDPRGRLLALRDRLAELLDGARRAAAVDGCRLVPFGHLAEGNLHLNHLGVEDPEELTAAVLRHVVQLGGTISAEHGIGVAKATWLPLVRSAADLAAQHRIKAALDPRDVLNPGVLDPGVLDPGGRRASPGRAVRSRTGSRGPGP